MNFLLDTNVVSEWVKPRPNPHVIRWLFEADEDQIFLSVITFAEIRQGIEGMAAGRRRDALEAWLEDELAIRFERRILGVDLAVANLWGAVIARSKKEGMTLHIMDGFLAAIAETHGMTLVTRNVRHFQNLGIQLFSPWTAAQ